MAPAEAKTFRKIRDSRPSAWTGEGSRVSRSRFWAATCCPTARNTRARQWIFPPAASLLFAPVIGAIGERVVCYFEQYRADRGRNCPPYRRTGSPSRSTRHPASGDKLASQLTWLANRHDLGLPEDRRHERIVPVVKTVVLTLDEGFQVNGKLIDVSLSGAGIALDVRPAIGLGVIVARHRRGSFATSPTA